MRTTVREWGPLPAMTTKGSMEEKFKTRAGYAQEMVKNIRILALNGKNNFRKFLFDPLYEAGWYMIPATIQPSLL